MVSHYHQELCNCFFFLLPSHRLRFHKIPTFSTGIVKNDLGFTGLLKVSEWSKGEICDRKLERMITVRVRVWCDWNWWETSTPVSSRLKSWTCENLSPVSVRTKLGMSEGNGALKWHSAETFDIERRLWLLMVICIHLFAYFYCREFFIRLYKVKFDQRK